MKIYETRDIMLSDLPKNKIVAELGVFKGDFSKIIYNTITPSLMILIDSWSDKIIGSGDVDGNNMTSENGLKLYEHVKNTFLNNEKVKIYRDYTSILSTFDDNFFDIIYIDADHTFDGCLFDLNLSFKKIKNGGYIMGHDYGQNMVKSKKEYNFGVVKAVNQFCLNNNQKISAITNDGCISYLIEVKK